MIAASSLLNMPTLDLKLTISFVGIPVVSLSVSSIREDQSLKKVMAPFGDLIQTVIKPGLGLND